MTKDKITDEYIKAVQKQFKHYHAADTGTSQSLCKPPN